MAMEVILENTHFHKWTFASLSTIAWKFIIFVELTYFLRASNLTAFTSSPIFPKKHIPPTPNDNPKD